MEKFNKAEACRGLLMAEAALLGKSVSSSSSSFYLIVTNDAKHMCQGNEETLSWVDE